MRARQLPRLWLMTDERREEALWRALARLPRGAGVVFRHHATPPAPRRALFAAARRVARARGLVLVLADDVATARAWRADGVHGRGSLPRRRGLLRTAPAHDLAELRRARGAALLFVSPVHATRSHPGAATLGTMRFAALAGATRMPVVALGGMDARRGRAAARLGAWGWAGIDAWSG